MTTEVTISFTPEEIQRLRVALLMARSTAEKEARLGFGGNDGADVRQMAVAFNDLLARVHRARQGASS